MKTNKKFLTILTLCIALLLTACGATDAAGTDKTNESLTETGTVSTDSQFIAATEAGELIYPEVAVSVSLKKLPLFCTINGNPA